VRERGIAYIFFCCTSPAISGKIQRGNCFSGYER
jgi:hypothetical protein